MKAPVMLSALAIMALPVMAQSQSISLIYTQLTPRDTTVDTFNLSADKVSSFGLRYSHDLVSLPKLGDARLAAEGTLLKKTSEKDIEGLPIPAGLFKYSYEYMGLGVSMMWTKVVDFGAVLDVRHESCTQKLTGLAPFELGGSKTFYRPWLSARVGYTFLTNVVKPFVSLEYSVPLIKKADDIGHLSEASLYGGEIAGSMNPKSQITLAAGVRF